MKKSYILAFIGAMIMLFVGCSTNKTIAKAEPTVGIVIVEMQSTFPVVSENLITPSFEMERYEFSGIATIVFVEKPDYVINLAPSGSSKALKNSKSPVLIRHIWYIQNSITAYLSQIKLKYLISPAVFYLSTC